MALAMASASSSVLKRISGATGPKVSSLASNMPAWASPSTVGLTNWLSPSGVPPQSRRAPWVRASSMCRATLLTAAALISGPMVTADSIPLPTRSLPTSSTRRAAKRS
ncbi:hypothetical protein D3C85_1239660 [compost metagenome]